MSRTEITIIHCDNCGETTSPQAAYEGTGWFHVAEYKGYVEYDYCSGKCLFEHAAVDMPGTA